MENKIKQPRASILTKHRRKSMKNPDVNLEHIQSRALTIQDEYGNDMAGGALQNTYFDFIPIRKGAADIKPEKPKEHKDVKPTQINVENISDTTIPRPSSIEFRRNQSPLPTPSSSEASTTSRQKPIIVKPFNYQQTPKKIIPESTNQPPPKTQLHRFPGPGLSDGIGSDGVLSVTSDDYIDEKIQSSLDDSLPESGADFKPKKGSSFPEHVKIKSIRNDPQPVKPKNVPISPKDIEPKIALKTIRNDPQPIKPKNVPISLKDIEPKIALLPVHKPHHISQKPKKSILHHRASISEKTIPIHERLRQHYASDTNIPTEEIPGKKEPITDSNNPWDNWYRTRSKSHDLAVSSQQPGHHDQRRLSLHQHKPAHVVVHKPPPLLNPVSKPTSIPRVVGNHYPKKEEYRKRIKSHDMVESDPPPHLHHQQPVHLPVVKDNIPLVKPVPKPIVQIKPNAVPIHVPPLDDVDDSHNPWEDYFRTRKESHAEVINSLQKPQYLQRRGTIVPPKSSIIKSHPRGEDHRTMSKGHDDLPTSHHQQPHLQQKPAHVPVHKRKLAMNHMPRFQVQEKLKPKLKHVPPAGAIDDSHNPWEDWHRTKSKSPNIAITNQQPPHHHHKPANVLLSSLIKKDPNVDKDSKESEESEESSESSESTESGSTIDLGDKKKQNHFVKMGSKKLTNEILIKPSNHQDHVSKLKFSEVVVIPLIRHRFFSNDGTWKMIDRGRTDFITKNALAAIRIPPKIPIPRYVDHYKGKSHLWCPSGLARFYIYKPDFGRVPGYIKERMKTFGIIRKKNTDSISTIDTSEFSMHCTREGNVPIDHEFGANYYEPIKQNPGVGRLNQDVHSWNHLLMKKGNVDIIKPSWKIRRKCKNLKTELVVPPQPTKVKVRIYKIKNSEDHGTSNFKETDDEVEKKTNTKEKNAHEKISESDSDEDTDSSGSSEEKS